MISLTHFFEVVSMIIAIFLPLGGVVLALAFAIAWPVRETKLYFPVFFLSFFMGILTLIFFAWIFWK